MLLTALDDKANYEAVQGEKTMVQPRSVKIVSIFLAAALVCGCAATGSKHRSAQRLLGQEQYEQAKRILQAETAENPQDPIAHRLLGIALYHLEDYNRAGGSLTRALELNPRDATAHFYMGMLAERTDGYNWALYHYQSFLSLKGTGHLADLTRRRMEDLKTTQAKDFARRVIDNEKEISPGMFSDSTIGVVYFDGRFLSAPLRPLATGLAELLVTDLSKVQALRVVERIRLNQILAELHIAQSAAFDTATAPRLGKLLGAAHMLGGTLAELPGEKLRIDPNLVNTRSGDVSLPPEAVGEFDQIISMEKEVALATIDRLGIKLTKAERDAIEKPPTESFLAFLMYAKGLELLDQGRIKNAAREFNRAAKTDPGFREAIDKAHLTEILMNIPASGSIEEFEQYAEADPAIRGRIGDIENNLLDNQDRLGFLPGTERGHDEPYTGPYGRRAPAGTVIIHGQFDNEP